MRSKFLLHKAAHCNPDEIWPDGNGKHAFPKGKMQKADCEQPAGKPRERREPVLLDFDFFHMIMD